MSARPVPPQQRRTRQRANEAPWTIVTTPAATKPRAPAGLGAAGRAWWNAAWTSPVSSLYDDAAIVQLRRGAKVADRADSDDMTAAMLVELRRLEDALGLTIGGRLKLRILIEPVPADEEDDTARERRARERRRRLEAVS